MKTALQIIKQELSCADDNLYRAKLRFGNLTPEELSKEYGESGQSCGEILDSCERTVREIKVIYERFAHQLEKDDP